MEPLAPTRARARRFFDTGTGIVFLLILAAPTLDHWVRPDERERSPNRRELRTPAPLPDFPRATAAALEYPKQFEAWFNDSMGLRDQLLRWNSIVKVFGFGVSPNRNTFLGRDGWMFYGGDNSKENHRGALPSTEIDLRRWAAMIERRRLLLKSIGVEYLFVIAPDKESIYADFLPDEMKPIGPRRLEQFVVYMRTLAPAVQILDLCDPLIAAREGDRPDAYLYTKLGTHWNERGAQVALRAMLERMNELVGGFEPRELDDFVRTELPPPGDSMATSMYIGDLLPMSIHEYAPPQPKAVEKHTGGYTFGRVRKSELADSTRPRVVLMHDSFGPQIEVGLSEQCSYLECQWNWAFDVDEVRRIRPKILVDLFVERTLNHADPLRFRPLDPYPWERRFAMSSSTLVAADKDASQWNLQGQGPIELGSVRELVRPRLPLVLGAAEGVIDLGTVVPVQGQVPVLHASIDSPLETELWVFTRLPGELGVPSQPKFLHGLNKGPNLIFLPLALPESGARVLIRPGRDPGTYYLRELEIRSVSQP